MTKTILEIEPPISLQVIFMVSLASKMCPSWWDNYLKFHLIQASDGINVDLETNGISITIRYSTTYHSRALYYKVTKSYDKIQNTSSMPY